MSFEKYFPIWDKLTSSQQASVQNSVIEKHISTGSIIHNGNMDCTGLLLVKEGQLRAFITSDEGHEITLYRLFDYDLCLFSASCMIKSIQFDIIISAEKDTQLLIIPTDVYKKIMDESITVANYTNELMASRFSDVMWLMEQIMWKSLDKRVAAFLIEESTIEGTVTLKITHETIANHLGSTREVITRMLRYFQNENIISLSRGTITILDKKKLGDMLS